MPVENPNPTLPEQSHDDWQQLAHQAREHWDFQHPGVAALYENHVVPQLNGKGLGHLAISITAEAGSSAPTRETDAQESESKPTRITVEQDGGDPITIEVFTGVSARQLRPDVSVLVSDSHDRVVDAEVAPRTGVEQVESERKKNTAENLRVLQKRFGERFVKGDLMEGGGYTGGAARELLAGFMDRPGFANELKRLIPNKSGALSLLKNNQAYIQATLEQRYKDDPTLERAPAKDPYELARSVGYELTGPFTSTSEFVPYEKQDFRSGERLCTFNEPTGRLRDYHILWLRHAEVDSTLPADYLTADNLNTAWKTYLKTIGRYDQAADSYDLAGLRPSRDDPYGTSSMSVQISRRGTHVSIKNRYNHTVGNPDNTLDSELDNVAYGLKRAVYARVAREDLMNKASVALAENYIADNEGGIHYYKYEENNVYYGEYEYIENGVVTTIDRGRYDMISPQLYVPKSGNGQKLNLRPKLAESAELAAGEDMYFLYRSAKANSPQGRDDPLTELRRAYAERDYAELKILSTERIRASFETSYKAYAEVTTLLGAEGQSQEAMRQLYEAKITQWQEDGVLDYIAERIITHGELHTPIMTPEGLYTHQQLSALAVAFGKDQPYETYVWDDLYSQYSPEELSGKQSGDSPVRFSLMPSKFTEELGSVPAAEQRGALMRLQQGLPRLNFHVPSVLDAISFWRTLRARGDALADNGAFTKTCIRHFDLPEKRVGSILCVPRSFVVDDGKPRLYDSGAGGDGGARVLVG